MILVVLISVLFFGGVLAWLSEGLDSKFPRIIALAAVLIDLLIMLTLLGIPEPTDSAWIISLNADWMPRFGISFHLALDGLSTLLLLLTGFLGVVAIGSAWNEITEKVGFFYFCLLWTLAGVVGVFTALDLFLFFFFWEVMLIPMYFIIAVWGHENKNYAAMKFFLFTQVTGMLMLVSILVLAYFHYVQFGWFSFDYLDLLNVNISNNIEMMVMLGFFVAFTTKLPSFPLHSWLPDAHSQAPTAGSVILAGILLKTGAYGLIRFAIPLFPEASMRFAPVAMTLAVISILYCAKVAFAQTDIKRLIAYTSISHMGFVLLGIYAWNEIALQGAIMTMLAHGLSAAALFMLAGGLQHRIHTRNMQDMGGFWAKVPRMSFVALFFSIAALGMPGLGNFVGEFLALLGAFQANITLTVLAAFGLIFASVYSLWVIQKVFHGEYKNTNFDDSGLDDLSRREMFYFGAMMLGLIWMGMYPQSFLDLSAATLNNLLSITEGVAASVVQTTL
ncbi:MAG: NADH-quinone oxidoreductase subunit M [SAR86 cluster bacterium]|uniref:NADH-quinone oxidoreductase subunit M n=1 Tax=SAR86 cluster bacterium TaxID=2030880 RepID=A0A2A5BAW7_9GAMM|nr:MAG: NADH-quinone oxidoreductase subunit M [SAR86 cluster bacterium]